MINEKLNSKDAQTIRATIQSINGELNSLWNDIESHKREINRLVDNYIDLKVKLAKISIELGEIELKSEDNK